MMKHSCAFVFQPAILIIALLFGPRSGCLADEGSINFNKDIRPILSDRCFACHGPDKISRKADLRLDQREAAIAANAIVPGHPEQSPVIERIFSHDDDTVMPPARSNKSLTDDQKNLLKKWIAEGAVYQPHWSLIPVPKQVPVPPGEHSFSATTSPIDAFVYERLKLEHLEPAPEATRETWLRRISFDLTGLPPTLEELDSFLSDNSPQAFEKQVDRLLGSSAFGERMANEWLDVARYADTFGYQADRDTHLWPWRDWVIRMFNQNLPYDQFIIWQTAGDLLPNPTPDQQLATAFNRLHRQTNEGGSIEEEFRQSYIADRVVTNGTAFLGLTLECARCHDHKYDPISQADFYRLAAFFSNIDEHGLYSHFTETAPTPAIPLFQGDQQTQLSSLQGQIAEKVQQLHQIRETARVRFATHPLSQSNPENMASLSELLNETNPERTLPATGDGSTQSQPIRRPKLHLNFDDVKPNGENTSVAGVAGKALEFSGDDPFPCAGSGQYGRNTPFSISVWVKPVEQKPRVIVLHQSVAAEDAAFRGYSLVLDEGKIQFSLVHFWPGNAIQVESQEAIPNGEWTQVTVTYDGSSEATGLHLFINGEPTEIKVNKDKLTRDIKYRPEWGDSNSGGVELALGARFRDVGFRGGTIDELSVFDFELSPLEAAWLGREFNPPRSLTHLKPLAVSDSAKFAHFLLRTDAPYQTAAKKLLELRQAENELVTQIRQIMAMSELPEPRPTHVLMRGAYDAPGELVTADAPASVLPFPEDYPRNRLGLARWMTDDRNPLTSRVAVNRFWSLFFGRGIVASVEDLGGQGQVPTHPELLDWLARDFMDHGWNVKRLCKQIVLSATYRQSSQPRDLKQYVDDPDNKLLARGPRYRLSAEQLRDNAIAVSGLLVRKLGGPSVMPYQPAGLWEEAGTGKSYAQSKGEGLYRRSLYTFWRRTSPPPSMLTFDATGREVCTARRERTATPLQALVLLNDPQFVEAARVLAEKLIHDSRLNLEAQIQSAFRTLTSRLPSSSELQLLTRLYNEQKDHFTASTQAAIEFLTIGESQRDERLQPAEHAAMTVVVATLMSFDECVTKR